MKKNLFKWSSKHRLLCVLFFALTCVNGAWAGYYKGQAVANVDGLSEEKKATVKVLATQTYYYVEGQWLEDASVSSTTSTTDALNDDYYGMVYYYIYFHATSSEGAYFEGWYSDAACTEFISANNPFEANKSEWSSSYDGFSSSENAEDAPITTLYAKFTSTPPVTYYAKVNFTTNIEKAGSFNRDSWYETNSYESNIQEEFETYTEESFSLSEQYIKVIAKRGYRFVDWSLLPGVNDQMAYDRAYDYSIWDYVQRTKDDNPTSFKITTTNTDPDYAGSSVRANLEELTAHTLTLQKAKNRGTVSVSCQGYIENGTGDGLEIGDIEGFTDLLLADNERAYAVYNTDAIVLTAEAAAGYTFQGWYVVEGGKNTLVSAENELSLSGLDNDATYLAYFNTPEVDDPVFKVGTISCYTLEDAIQASNSSKTILLCQDYTVPKGNYTIPTGVTLLIPKSAEQLVPEGNILSRTHSDNATPSVYLTLTLEDSVVLNVNGAIEVGGSQNIAGQGVAGVGHPHGGYGRLVMEPGSHITLNSGSKLYAWGFVTGTTDENGNYLSGEIDVRRNAEVHEQFQMMDWKGGTATSGMIDNLQKVFPINQYFIQNVEVPATYRPGSRLITATGVYAGGTDVLANNVQIIGVYYDKTDPRNDVAMFLMDQTDDSEDTWVRKSYDIKNDLQVYEVNNSAHLGSITIALAAGSIKYTMMSKNYALPITNNMKIHLLNGNMDITQNTVLLAGAELEIDKKCTFTVAAGDTLYLYDSDEWDTYAANITDAASNVMGQQVLYTPTYGDKPNKRPYAGSTTVKPGDATINVKGSLVIAEDNTNPSAIKKGAIYTTNGGANIYSSIDNAGTVTFNAEAPTTLSTVYQYKHGGDPTMNGAESKSAWLKNDAGSVMGNFSHTAGTAAGKSYHFIDIDGDGSGEWVNLTEDECFVYDQSGIYYIKPQAYVPISSGKPAEEDDHTYRDHYAGSNKIYIEAGCQWWEVTATATPGIFHCEHPDNDTYYYHDGDVWVEKKFKVSWVNWDGSPVKYKPADGDSINYYMVTYGTVPTWLSANPMHADDASHTYAFKGWMPEPAAVTEDITYTATYQERDRMYAITFNDENDELIQVVYCKLGVMPECTKYNAAANSKEWTPTIGLVTGNQTYKLKAQESKYSYTVTWKNWNGDVIRTDAEKTTMPAKPSDPTKADDALHSYDFAAWSPTPMDEGETLTADVTYTATYTAGPKTFTIRFFKENGTSQIGEDIEVAYGVVPTPPTYSKATANHTVYTLVWSPLVAAATGDQDYIATFTEAPEQFTVTWKNGTQTLAVDHVNYGVTPAYSGLTPTKEDETKIYTFTGWSPAIAAVTADQVYTAQFDEGHLKSVTVGTSDSYATAGHVETLILKASESASGQITANVTATNAYFDLTINATTTLATGATRQWHAFGVPWQVNLDTDPIQEVGGSNRTFVLGRDYDIIYYNGAKRAASGAGYWCWEFLENHLHLLQPGQGYMIAFAPSIGEVGTIRFVKKNLAPVIFNGTMTVDANTGTVANNSGWNAIANPKACKVTLNAGPTTGYVYNPATDNYSAFNIENRDYIVGKVVYIQANATQSVAINNATGNPFIAAAPARRTEVADKEYLSLDDYYQVAIASTTTEGGHVYVLPEEGKENKYVIGHDLAQFGMSAAIPQVWVNRYDTKLALNTTALNNETAEFPMGVYAPNAGEYTISLNAQPSDEYNVYLTRDGQAIWNLSDGAFTADLKAGIQSNYGLRLTVNKAPQVVTGIDEAIVDANGETKKVLINNQVFIIRGEQVYSIDGQIVK